MASVVNYMDLYRERVIVWAVSMQDCCPKTFLGANRIFIMTNLYQVSSTYCNRSILKEVSYVIFIIIIIYDLWPFFTYIWVS